ncbi:hypothetical protein D3C72_2358370 [compost metagenome]
MGDEFPRCMERGQRAADHNTVVSSRIAVTWGQLRVGGRQTPEGSDAAIGAVSAGTGTDACAEGMCA